MALYDAFVSYSHLRDKPIAGALQSVVQTLGKPWYRRRALRVFRDDTSLSATPSLWPSIEQALGQSRFLILLASPEAAASPWVNKEISFWLEKKGPETLLIALTDGELAWDEAVGDFGWREGMPLPPVLTGRFASEPKWVDLRAYRAGADPRDAKFTELAADFAAAIHGIPKEDLLSQEVRQQRRALRLAWGAACSLLLLTGVAGWQWKVAIDQRDRAEKTLAAATRAANSLIFELAREFRNRTGMPMDLVRKILERAQELQRQLAESGETSADLRRSEAIALMDLSRSLLALGDTKAALTAAERAREIMNRLLAGNPSNDSWRYDLSVSLVWIGDVRRAAGDRTGTLAAYEESLAIVRTLAAADPGNARWQAALGANLIKVGDARLDAGDRAAALSGYEESLAIARKLAAADPGNAMWQLHLSASLNKVGDVRLDTGDHRQALVAYEESLAIMRSLAAADSGNAEWQRNVHVSLDKVGEAREAAGDLTGALAAYEESLAIARKLAAADPGNTQWQRDISVNLDNVGDVRRAAGDRAGALAAYEESLAIARKLAVADPGNAGWQRDLSVSLNNVGDMRLATGDRSGALAAYEEGLAIRRKLAVADPGNVARQADLVFSLWRVSTASDPAQARAVLREALAIAEALAREDKLTTAQQDWLKRLQEALAKLPPEQAEAR